MMRWACHPNAGKGYILEDFEYLVDHNADRMNKFATTAEISQHIEYSL